MSCLVGWLCTRALWNELQPKWPIAFWDDWLREPAQRRGRAFLRPELSRTHTFGRIGASKGQYFDIHLRKNALSGANLPFHEYDWRYLLRPHYDYLMRRMRALAERASVDFVTSGRCEHRLVSVSAGSPAEFTRIAKLLGVMSDIKWGIPRTGYGGAVVFVRGTCTVMLLMPLAATQDNFLVLAPQADGVDAAYARDRVLPTR